MEEDYNVDDFVVSTVDEVSNNEVTEENQDNGTVSETDNLQSGTEEDQFSDQEDNDKLLNSLRKLLSEQNDEQSEEGFDEVSGGQTNDDSDEEPEEVEEQVIDYSATLISILDELELVNSNYESLQTYLEETNDNNSMDSTLSSQSATNVLLCIAIIVALIDLVYHFAKGVL